MAVAIRLRGASAQCSALQFEGHDNGLGFLMWMHRIETVFLAPKGLKDGKKRAHPRFHSGDVFHELKNLSETSVGAALNRSREENADRYAAELAQFLFIHKGRPAPDMFLTLRALGDNETAQPRLRPFATTRPWPVVGNTGFECTAYEPGRKSKQRRRRGRAVDVPWRPSAPQVLAAPRHPRGDVLGAV